MPFTIEKPTEEPIVILTITLPFDINTQIHETFAAVADLIEDEEAPVYVISDFREFPIDFATMTAGLASSTKAIKGSPSDPRIRALPVATDEMSKFAVDAMKQDQYGNRDFSLFTSVEKALAFARENLGVKP